MISCKMNRKKILTKLNLVFSFGFGVGFGFFPACVFLISGAGANETSTLRPCEQNSVVEMLKKVEYILEGKIAEQRAETEKLREKINAIALQNPVPNGFVYVQFGNQPSPEYLWPDMIWTEITIWYAGLFFRAEGGGSDHFGWTQEENHPHISHAHRTNDLNPKYQTIKLNGSGWSNYLDLGRASGTAHWNLLRFYTSGGEVRPRNQAIRIWKRTA